MIKDIFLLAFQGALRKKRSSILIFSVLLLSFAFAIASVSLTGSISKTNKEFRLNTYGEWYFAIPDGLEEDAIWLQRQSWAETTGISHSYGYVLTEVGKTGIGTVDENFKSIGRLRLNAGRWPEADNEVAMEEDTLSALGYDYTLGQEVTIPIAVPSGEERINFSGTFVLCGIVREYTDLWVLNPNGAGRMLNGAIVTENCANQILKSAEASLLPEDIEQGAGANPPVFQYFVTVGSEQQESVQDAINDYLAATRVTGDHRACVNSVAYQGAVAAEYDDFYAVMIAVVAMLAVLCIYIIQLPAETKSFAILRSLGITRGQMGALLLAESLLLCLPALALGIPASIGVTRLAMRLLVYAGSVPIQVAIPWDAVYAIALLWIGVVVVSRLLVYFVTLRTPLSGRMQMQRKNARRTKVFHSALIIVLLTAFGFITAFTSIEVLPLDENRKSWSSYPPYTIYMSGINGVGTVSLGKVELLRQVPGISKVEGFGELRVNLSYPGLEEREVYLYAVNEQQWEETFRFGEDQEAFHNGDLVFVLFPGERASLPPDTDDTDRNFAFPEEDVTLRLYDSEGVCVMESEPTPAKIRWMYETTPNKMLAGVYDAYTVVCSEAYLKNILESMEPGTRWGKRYTAGEPFGYGRVYAYVELTADDLSTDIGMAELCKKLDVFLSNRREQFQANMQQYTQEILLLCGSGICISAMILLILVSTISLETEREKRSFAILQRLGMSSWQRRGRIWGKAFGRSICGVTLGWLLFIGYKTAVRVRGGAVFTEAVPNLPEEIKAYGMGFAYLAFVFAVTVLILLIINILPKRHLEKEVREL